MKWLKAQALEPGMIVEIPADDPRVSPRGEVLSIRSVDPTVMCVELVDRSTWIHPEEKVEVVA